MVQFLLWVWAGQRYGLRLEAIEQVFQIVEIAPLARPHPYVAGLVNVYGEVLPVLKLPHEGQGIPHSIGLHNQLILAHEGTQRCLILTESVLGLESVSVNDVLRPDQIGATLPLMTGVLRRLDGLVWLPDVAGLLHSAQWDNLTSPTAPALPAHA